MQHDMDFNKFHWEFQEWCGWWFWVPFIGYGIYGLNIMYRLAPAVTPMGRVIRVILTIGFFSMIFIFQFNGLGPYAFHFTVIGVLLINRQMYQACLRDGRIQKPQADTVLGRTVERMVER